MGNIEKIDWKNKQSFRSLKDERPDICIIKFQGDGTEIEAEKSSQKIITETSNLAKTKTLPIQEDEQIAKDELKEVKAKTYHN